MARPESILDPSDGPVAEFAHELRELRREAGGPSYRSLAQRAHYSSTTLSEATRGVRLPSLDVTRAYVRACGADEREWARRWRETDARLRLPLPEPTTTRPHLLPSAVRTWWVAVGALLVMLIAVAAAATTTLVITMVVVAP